MLGSEPLWQAFSRRRAGARNCSTPPPASVSPSTGGQRRPPLGGRAPAGRDPQGLWRGARILILDEPTAVLTPQESEQLFETLSVLVREGLSLVFISHKLAEVLRVCDRVAVLRAGRLVAERPARGTSRAELAELMVGRSVQAPTRLRRAPARSSSISTRSAPRPGDTDGSTTPACRFGPARSWRSPAWPATASKRSPGWPAASPRRGVAASPSPAKRCRPDRARGSRARWREYPRTATRWGDRRPHGVGERRFRTPAHALILALRLDPPCRRALLRHIAGGRLRHPPVGHRGAGAHALGRQHAKTRSRPRAGGWWQQKRPC